MHDNIKSTEFHTFQLDESGKTVIFGFTDGSIRVTCFDIDENNWNSSSIKTTQYIKPHLDQIKEIHLNGNVAVSTSQDQTIFIFAILQSSNGISLIPVGFIPVNTFIQRIVCFAWETNEVKPYDIALIFYPVVFKFY